MADEQPPRGSCGGARICPQGVTSDNVDVAFYSLVRNYSAFYVWSKLNFSNFDQTYW
jgi:hypothetical protein